MEDSRSQINQSPDACISESLKPNPDIIKAFDDAQRMIGAWVNRWLPDRDNMDIETVKFYPTKSGPSERRNMPARVEHFSLTDDRFLEYDKTAHEQLMSKLLIDDKAEELQISSLLIGAELVRQLFESRRTQPKGAWNRMQRGIANMHIDAKSLYDVLEKNCEDLSDDFLPVLEEVRADLLDSSEERLQRINTIRLLLGVTRQAFTSEHTPTHFNFSTQSVDLGYKSFWRGLGHELWERDQQRGLGIESFPPVADYIIAGCAPMSDEQVYAVISKLR